MSRVRPRMIVIWQIDKRTWNLYEEAVYGESGAGDYAQE